MLKFILVLGGAVILIIVASIAWGRFTTAPKPEALEAVEGAMIDTSAGQAIAEVFGVSDSQPVEPINLADAARSAAGSLATTLTSRVEQAVANQAIIAVARQFDQLPEDQRTLLTTMICQPPAQ